MNPNETPRTDAEWEKAPRADYGGMTYMANHARQLEKELNEAKNDYESLLSHHEATDKIIIDAQGLRPETGKALLHNYDQLKAEVLKLQAAIAVKDEALIKCAEFRDMAGLHWYYKALSQTSGQSFLEKHNKLMAIAEKLSVLLFTYAPWSLNFDSTGKELPMTKPKEVSRIISEYNEFKKGE